MISEGLEEMFEGDSADMCAVKFPLVTMGGRAEDLTCADPGARTPIGAIMFLALRSAWTTSSDDSLKLMPKQPLEDCKPEQSWNNKPHNIGATHGSLDIRQLIYKTNTTDWSCQKMACL